MIKSIESTGTNEEEAINAALRKLGLSRDDVSVEVLDRGKKGFLGIGSVPAKVRLSYEVDEPAAPQVHNEPKAAPKAAAPSKPAQKPASPAPKAGTKAAEVHSFLKGLFERMGVEADISISENAEDGTINVELSGEHVGTLIGRRGETLDAIQHLSNYVINSGDDEHTRINIDAENYRAKRTEALESLAKKVAGKVVKYRRSVTLEPMNAYERHVIHTALQDYPGVTTYSTGTEPNRRIVVAYEHSSGNSYYSGRSGGQRRERSQSSRAPRRDRPAVSTPAPAEQPEPAPVKNTTREWH